MTATVSKSKKKHKYQLRIVLQREYVDDEVYISARYNGKGMFIGKRSKSFTDAIADQIRSELSQHPRLAICPFTIFEDVIFRGDQYYVRILFHWESVERFSVDAWKELCAVLQVTYNEYGVGGSFLLSPMRGQNALRKFRSAIYCRPETLAPWPGEDENDGF